jgi:shikimate kinase
MKNIILIGFMGSGKTSVGSKIASMTSLKLADIDSFIVKDSKMEINEIFVKFGEEYFRRLETLAAKKVCSMKNRIISTGGGIVTRPENFGILKNAGCVVYLKNSFNVSVKRLAKSKDRPLFDRANLKKTGMLYRKRLKLYDRAADITIITDKKTVTQTAKEVIKKAGIFFENNQIKAEK